MRYMIHACPARMWYVERYLHPSLLAQGIRAEDIIIWNDEAGDGCLVSCMKAFLHCGATGHAGTWHLQDDVVICRDFKARTEAHDDGIVTGFLSKYGPCAQARGRVVAGALWWSFPCIRIPDALAEECAEWFFADAQHRPCYEQQVKSRKEDDLLFRDFLLERYPRGTVYGLTPNLVDHVDVLIGGSEINPQRQLGWVRSIAWEDESIVTELTEKLERDKKAGR